MYFDLIAFVKIAGYFGVWGFVFAESGLFVGFFLPGDSLLFTAGFLASQGILNIWLLVIGSFIFAVAGVSVGYAFGYKVGPALFNKEDSFIFSKRNVEVTQKFYEKHGGKAIILARFMPVIRTFAPILAGVGKMNYSQFFVYNLIGGFLWAVGLCFGGYILGNIIPNVDRYLLPIIVLIIVLSVLPSAIHILRDKETRDGLLGMIFKKKDKSG